MIIPPAACNVLTGSLPGAALWFLCIDSVRRSVRVTIRRRSSVGVVPKIASTVPLLNDDVWRLKKISKDGVFHEALRGAGIFSVQDFLRFYYKDEPALHKILIKATELVWTTIVEHAKKCDPGRELYSFVVEGNNVMLFFNSVYQIVGATFGDNYTPFSDLDDTGKVS
ncbi:hypothetical protein ACP70R_045531 [Stipagrostis hirtigluma subsp. patula]